MCREGCSCGHFDQTFCGKSKVERDREIQNVSSRGEEIGHVAMERGFGDAPARERPGRRRQVGGRPRGGQHEPPFREHYQNCEWLGVREYFEVTGREKV